MDSEREPEWDVWDGSVPWTAGWDGMGCQDGELRWHYWELLRVQNHGQRMGNGRCRRVQHHGQRQRWGNGMGWGTGMGNWDGELG